MERLWEREDREGVVGVEERREVVGMIEGIVFAGGQGRDCEDIGDKGVIVGMEDSGRLITCG